MIILLASVFVSCEANVHISDATWDAVERISGRYILESVTIESPGIDIDGDGIPENSLLPMILEQGYLGMQVLEEDASFVIPASGPDRDARMEFYAPVGRLDDSDIRPWVSAGTAISCIGFSFRYRVASDGTLSLTYMSNYSDSALTGATLSLEEENRAVLSYQCRLFDFQSRTIRPVAVTCSFSNTTRK